MVYNGAYMKRPAWRSKRRESFFRPFHLRCHLTISSLFITSSASLCQQELFNAGTYVAEWLSVEDIRHRHISHGHSFLLFSWTYGPCEECLRLSLLLPLTATDSPAYSYLSLYAAFLRVDHSASRQWAWSKIKTVNPHELAASKTITVGQRMDWKVIALDDECKCLTRNVTMDKTVNNVTCLPGRLHSIIRLSTFHVHSLQASYSQLYNSWGSSFISVI